MADALDSNVSVVSTEQLGQYVSDRGGIEQREEETDALSTSDPAVAAPAPQEVSNAESDGAEFPSGSDYPEPSSLSCKEQFIWNADDDPVDNFYRLGEKLAKAGDLFRNPAYAGGLLLASESKNIPLKQIKNGQDLASVIFDRLRVRVTKNGKDVGSRVPSSDLKIMLKSEAFLQRFKPVYEVSNKPLYLPDIQLTKPGDRRPSHDPLRQALGLLGAARPNRWHTSTEWAADAVALGVAKIVVGTADQRSQAGLARGMGVVLSAHQEETFYAETDEEQISLRLHKERHRRKDTGQPATCYAFEVLERILVPVEDDDFTDLTSALPENMADTALLEEIKTRKDDIYE